MEAMRVEAEMGRNLKGDRMEGRLRGSRVERQAQQSCNYCSL